MPIHQIKPSLRWSNEQKPLIAQIAVSALGLSGPIVVGAMTGQIESGMTASMGGLAMAAAIPQTGFVPQLTGLTRDLLVTCAGFFGGLFLSTSPAPLVMLVLCAALLSSSARSMVRLMNLFVIFALIGSGMKIAPAQIPAALMLFVCGGVWSGLLCLTLLPVCRLLGLDRPIPAGPTGAPLRQQLQHWKQSLHHFSGWQYPLRLTGELVAGSLLGHYFIAAHTYWILLTVFLVQERHFPASMRKTFDRAGGTVVGVVLVSPVLSLAIPAAMLSALIFVLAAVRPVLKSANYLAYSAIMTPLIILIMSLGHAAQLQGALTDRLLATLIACALVLISDKFMWPRIAGSTHRQ